MSRKSLQAQPGRAADRASRLVSVNVGLPKDVGWRGKTVFTGVFKDPVTGPRRVAKLNVEGDGQGDLAGHGGEQRAVFVYRLDSYRHVHARRVRRACAAHQRWHRRHTGPRDAQRAGGEALPSGDLVAARRTQRPRALVRHRDAGSPRSVPNSCVRVYYSRPDADDLEGRDFDAAGRLTPSLLLELEPPRNAEAYICGPTRFMDEISAGLASIGVDASHIHTEPFGPEAGSTPGIASKPARKPHPPVGSPGGGPARVRPQQPLRIVEQRLWQPARACRGLRRARALVLPDRRLPDLRDDADRR
jgi:hypothetical protein